jgi:hypothetical protein
MKIKRFHLIFAFLFLLSGCNGDDTATKNNSSGDSSFLTATINGKEFSSSLQVINFRAGEQTYLSTADNKTGVDEYEFNLIIQNDKDNNPAKIRYGFIELKQENEAKAWKLPDNFDFTETNQTGTHLEGTFSFTADAWNGIRRDTSDQLIVTDGRFRANKKGGV